MGSSFGFSGPHIETPETVETNMWNVVLALIPAIAVGVYFFGLYTLYLVIAGSVSAVFFEKPFIKSSSIYGDGSSFLAGTLLALSLPPTSPWWLPILGSFLAVTIGKVLFGGLGSNIFNPALISRAILLISYPSIMTEWISPVDGLATATPLQSSADAFNYTQLITGNIPGSIGETSALAILIGGVYLYIKGYIDLKIPLSFLAGAAGTAFLYGQDPVAAVFSGAIIFVAIFMATDMVTSPVSKWAKVVYGLIGGALTIFIRRYTPYPEGVTFAVLIINGAAYFLDDVFEGPHFGEVELVKKKIAHFASIAIAAVLIFVAGMALVNSSDSYPGNLKYSHLKQAAPEADKFEVIERKDNDVLFGAVAAEENIKDLIYISRNGFEAPIEILMEVNNEGKIEEIEIVHESESPTLGARVKDQEFLQQFNKFTTADADQVLSETDMISGATYSSQTVARAVQAGLNLYISDQDSGLQDGVYTGQGEGLNGAIVLELTVESGDITDLKIIEEQETEHLAGPAYEELKAQLLDKQNAELDIVSGATYTSEGFMDAAEEAISKASPESGAAGVFADLADGEYKGSAQGHKSEIELSLKVSAGELTEIETLSQNETVGLGDTAIEEMKTAILEEQSLEVDTVSGATNSSQAVINAVKDAVDAGSAAETDSDTAGSEENADETAADTDTDSAATSEEEYTEETGEAQSSDAESSDALVDLSSLDLKAGEYEGSAEGHKSTIEVSVLVENNSITEINILSQNETEGLGDAAIEEMKTKVLNEQSLALDTVSGATNSSEAFLRAVNNALANNNTDQAQSAGAFADLADGEYKGSAQGHKSEIELSLKVSAGELTEIEILSQNETEGLGDTAIEEMKTAILEEQSLEVDTVSGATNSSQAVINAVKDAINTTGEEEQGGGTNG